jgi:hypothetical protein
MTFVEGLFIMIAGKRSVITGMTHLTRAREMPSHILLTLGELWAVEGSMRCPERVKDCVAAHLITGMLGLSASLPLFYTEWLRVYQVAATSWTGTAEENIQNYLSSIGVSHRDLGSQKGEP